jgi:ubiquinone/menaquinone biosynthesis C-methylase UbiE
MKKLNNMQNKTTKTDWGNVSERYDKYLQSEDSYHSSLIWPNLSRLITKELVKQSGNKNSFNILDIACGQGLIASLIKNENKNVNVYGFDLAMPLIEIAKSKYKDVDFRIQNAESFDYDVKFDIATCVLAVQNIENFKKVIESLDQVLNPDGKFYLVINHPAYRIPKFTSWGYDNDIQYRRVDKYMSEDKIKLDMTPSEKRDEFKQYTYSFHRPLQYYFKILNSLNYSVTRLEEWVSDKESVGKHADRENTARKEFPMFMCLEISKKI